MGKVFIFSRKISGFDFFAGILSFDLYDFLYFDLFFSLDEGLSAILKICKLFFFFIKGDFDIDLDFERDLL